MNRAGEDCARSTRWLTVLKTTHYWGGAGVNAACDGHGHGRISEEEDTTSRESGTLVTLKTICFVKTFCALKAISRNRS